MTTFLLNRQKLITEEFGRSSKNALPTAFKNCLDRFSNESNDTYQFDPSTVQSVAPVEAVKLVENKFGLEIGGPSPFTWEGLKFYDVVRGLDVSNYAGNTLWESGIIDQSPFTWKNRTLGKFFIRDAVDLQRIPKNKYDFILASHVLEHIANPIKALLEWLRVLRSNGFLFIIVPSKELIFDRRRPDTQFKHLIDDYKKRRTEADRSHIEEVLSLHDIAADPGVESIEVLRVRSQKKFENRAIHQHIYTQEVLHQIFLCLDIDIKAQYSWHIHLMIIGQKK